MHTLWLAQQLLELLELLSLAVAATTQMRDDLVTVLPFLSKSRRVDSHEECHVIELALWGTRRYTHAPGYKLSRAARAPRRREKGAAAPSRAPRRRTYRRVRMRVSSRGTAQRALNEKQVYNPTLVPFRNH